MKKYNALFLSGVSLLVISLSVGCSPGKEPWKFDTLTCSKRIHIDNDTTKGGMKLDLNFVYPVSVPSSLNLKELQDTFARFFLGDEMPGFKGTIHEAFDETVKRYTKQAQEYAEDWKEMEGLTAISFSDYQDSRHIEVMTDTIDLITISDSYSAYVGGAHGAYGTTYYNIDKKDGALLTEKRLYKPGYESKLAGIIQNVVAERNNSQNEDDHIVLLVELEEVLPNQNFYFSNKGIVYVYNIYDIAPYSQGMVKIVIPYNAELLGLVNEQYLPLIKKLAG